MKKIYGLFLLVALGALTGCMTTTAYHWGEYEEQVYRMYAAPDQATAEIQLETLEEDLEKAASANKPLPPGLRAHMGFLYYQVGRYDEAKAAFTAEKASFPESTQMMDRLINRSGGSNL